MNVLRRSLRTRITTRVLMLSATVGVLLSATLVLLIIAVTGQRDAGRIAFRSQQALTLTSRLETSLLAIGTELRDYVRDPAPPAGAGDRPPERLSRASSASSPSSSPTIPPSSRACRRSAGRSTPTGSRARR